MPKKTKQEWVEILKAARNNIPFGLERCKYSVDWAWPHFMDDNFLIDILNALHYPVEQGAADFIKILNENQLNSYVAKQIRQKWNDPKSPVRNFLISIRINYPISKLD